MTPTEAREFIRNHFEEFVNRENVEIGQLNFAPDFIDHGADVPPALGGRTHLFLAQHPRSLVLLRPKSQRGRR